MDANAVVTQPRGSKILQGAMIAAVPFLLTSQGGPVAMWSVGGWMVRGLMLGALPPVFLCSVGIVEGAARSVVAGMGCLAGAASGQKHLQERRWEVLKEERNTTLGLAEGMLCPPVGYALCLIEGVKWADYDKEMEEGRNAGEGHRSLIHDYYVYRGSYEGYRGARFVTAKGMHYSYEGMKFGLRGARWTALRVNDVLTAVGFWKGVRFLGVASGKLLNAGLGLAFKLLPSGN